MIELKKALGLAGKHPILFTAESVNLEKAPGRVLAEDVYSDRDVPSFPRATMDGYACRRQDLPGPLVVLETIPAGKVSSTTVGRDQCCKIMTGAMVPEGADCVIMKEFVKTEKDGRIVFAAGETDTHIDPRGQDLREGDLLLGKGTVLGPEHIGIIASTGMSSVRVAGSVVAGILATGSELIDPGQLPEGAQVRNSNSSQLAAQVHRAGHTGKILGIVEDDREKLAGRISDALDKVDLLLLTGGASVGELDLVPGVLQELGFKIEFNRVAIQPGKPVCFAHANGKVCFGLSGNPVSSFVQFEVLVRPYLEICKGAVPLNRRIRIQMENGYRRERADRQFFLPVVFNHTGNCEPVGYHGSGHLHALARVNGFAEIPAGQNVVEKGEFVYVRLI